jgi:hypothetical protein
VDTFFSHVRILSTWHSFGNFRKLYTHLLFSLHFRKSAFPPFFLCRGALQSPARKVASSRRHLWAGVQSIEWTQAQCHIPLVAHFICLKSKCLKEEMAFLSHASDYLGLRKKRDFRQENSIQDNPCESQSIPGGSPAG